MWSGLRLRANNFMNIKQRITRAIEQFNQDMNNQVNLYSASARDDLAEMIYDAIMKQIDFNDNEGTYNQQQMYLFTNKEQSEHK